MRGSNYTAGPDAANAVALEQPDPVLTENTTATDVDGWDNLRMVLIIVAVQEPFGMRLMTREIDSLATVGDFATLIRGRTSIAV